MGKNSISTLFSRRDFLQLSSLTAACYLVGCATNPVTGRSQLMLVSEEQETSIDKKNSPFQFSQDYGISQDRGLNSYLDLTGKNIAAYTHRPDVVYSFYAVNAVYANAYAFPGGTIGITRGILVSLSSEAELAALLSHEMGHVNARHTAQQMSKGTLLQGLVSGLSIYAGTKGRLYGQLASQIGSLGAGTLLASYSRDHERQADELALEYMTKAGYNPTGMMDLMDMLQSTSEHNPNLIELMFSTHPMSSERYDDAKKNIRIHYYNMEDSPFYRERYMDNTAKLRSMKSAIEEMQKGEKQLRKKQCFPFSC